MVCTSQTKMKAVTTTWSYLPVVECRNLNGYLYNVILTKAYITIPLTLLLLVANLAKTRLCKNMDTWILIWEHSARIMQWIPTWQGLDVFQKSLLHWALDKNSLSNGRINNHPPPPPILRGDSYARNQYRHVNELLTTRRKFKRFIIGHEWSSSHGPEVVDVKCTASYVSSIVGVHPWHSKSDWRLCWNHSLLRPL